MTANVHVIPTRPRPIVDLEAAVADWETADLLLRSGECGDWCLCSGRDDRDHECCRCGDCEQTLAAREDEARHAVAVAVVSAGLAVEVADVAGAA